MPDFVMPVVMQELLKQPVIHLLNTEATQMGIQKLSVSSETGDWQTSASNKEFPSCESIGLSAKSLLSLDRGVVYQIFFFSVVKVIRDLQLQHPC